ncbi:MAG: 1,4-dihydroxy-2-naphthoate octaprenyltransferase [Woeseiaceae bacterium]|nr:1,4-dihydroxy-2-naphthoate octaprenyltransferase [Woeseiaceae bacterium]
MCSELVQQNDPLAERFAGSSVPQTLKRLFHATRPKFYPASILPVIAGSIWGFRVSGGFEVDIFLLALLATVCVHAAANVLNDVDDDSGGTDRINSDRIYPYTGGSRFIQTGIMSSRHMAGLGVALLAMAGVAGLALLLLKGSMILAFGVAGVALAVLYSLGPVRLSGLGIGEAAVGIGFGVLPVMGAAWLQSGTMNVDALLFSLPVSAWVAAILLINEVPDIAADGQSGKRTLPVRLGLGGTRIVYLGLHASALLVTIYMAMAGLLPLATPLGPAALMLLAYKASLAISQGLQDREAMRKAIEATLGIHMLGIAWLCGATLYSVLSS